MTKLFKRIKQYIEKFKNKHSSQELGQEEIRTEKIFIIKQPSNEVLELARKFKNISTENKNLIQNDTSCPNVRDELYIQFEKFICENSEGEKRPSNFEIENEFGIQERKRKELIEFGINKGFLIRKNATNTIFNINYEWEDVG